MDNVIGYKGTPEDRSFNWQAMIVYKQGYKILKEDPETKDIADEDKKRYKRLIKKYVQ